MFPILIIEDDPGMRVLLRQAVAETGLNPVTCPTPTDREGLCRAVDVAVKTAEPVAVLLDLGLPGVEEGQMVLDHLRQARPDMPVVAVSADRRMARPLERQGVTLVKKDSQLKSGLQRALSGLPLKPGNLGYRVDQYLYSVWQAVNLWRTSQGAARQSLAAELQDELGGLSHDHREHLVQLARALGSGGEWPPALTALREMRSKVSRLAGLLGPSEARRAHYLSHKLAGNVLLGLEYIQLLLHDSRVACRLRQAASTDDSGVHPERLRLLERVAQCLEQRDLRDVDRVRALEDCFVEQTMAPPTVNPVAYRLPGWGRITRVLVVENDEILHRFLQSSLSLLFPGLEVAGASNSHDALARITRLAGPRTSLVLLDLSIPRSPGAGEEHPDFGREVLKGARDRGCPVVVMSAVARLPDCLRSTSDLHPWDFLPKSTPQEIRDRLGSLLCPLAQEADSKSPGPVLVLRNRGRQILVDRVLVDVGPSCVRLLRVLARFGQEASLQKVLGDEDFLQTLRGYELGEPEAVSRKRVADRVRDLNQACRSAMAARGLGFDDLVQVEGQSPAVMVRSLRTLVVVPPEVDRLEDVAEEPGPLEPPPESQLAPFRVLLVDPDRSYAEAERAWLTTTFPGRLDKDAIHHAATLDEARAEMASSPPYAVVVLELLTQPSTALPPSTSDRAVEPALEWMRSVASEPVPPDIVVLTRSDEPVHEARVTAGPYRACVYIRKGSSEVESRAWLCLAVSEAWRRRFGYPRLSDRLEDRPLEVRLMPAGDVELDGVPITVHQDDPPKPEQRAARLVLQVLAANPLIPVDHEVLWDVVLAGAEQWEPVPGAQDAEQGDLLKSRFITDVLAECRRAVVQSFSRRGRSIGFEHAITTLGKRACRLNAIESDGRI